MVGLEGHTMKVAGHMAMEVDHKALVEVDHMD